MKQRRFLISILIVLHIVFFGTVFYAYFQDIAGRISSNIEYDSSEKTYIEINSIEEFAYYMIDTNSFNNPELVSEERKTLKLMADLKLTNDLVMKSDYHINLNEHQFNLNGFKFSIYHNYIGTHAIYNGTITDLNENVIDINTPNAVIVLSETLTLDNVSINTQSSDSSTVFELAFRLFEIKASNVKMADINTILLDKNYQILIGRFSPFYSDQFIEKRNCLYVYDDLDFPLNFYNHEVLYSYSSSNQSVVSNDGKVAQVDETLKVSLEVTVEYQGTIESRTYDVFVVADTDYHKAGAAVVAESFEKYSFSEVVIDEQTNETRKAYAINGAFMLPYKNDYFNSVFEYTLLDKDGVELESSSDTDKVLFEDMYYQSETSTISLGYILYLNKSVEIIRVYYNNKTEWIDIPVVGKSEESIVDNFTYANLIVADLFNSVIEISRLTKEVGVENEFSSVELPINSLKHSSYGLVGLSYEIINNSEKTYYIDNNVLKVNPNRLDGPDILQKVFLNVTCYFENAYTPANVTVSVPIRYIENENNPVGVSRFQPYYSYFNREIVTRTNGYTYNDFYIPFTYGADFPIYRFSIDIIDEDGNEVENTFITLRVVKNNTIIFNSISDFNMAVDEYNGLASNEQREATDLYDLIYGGSGLWFIDIDQTKIPVKDSYVTFKYDHYFEKDNNINLTTFQEEPFSSKIIVPGILRYGNNEAFTSHSLYQYIFGIYHSDETYSPQETFIITSRLSRYTESLMFENDSSMIPYKGLEYLTGVEKLYMKNSGITINDMQYISKMNGLKYLDLSFNGLRDAVSVSDFGFPNGNNNFIVTLSELSNLEVLLLNDNQIYRFDGLDDFPSLKEVHVYNNEFVVNITSLPSFIRDEINNLFTGIVNEIYGTKGALNRATFAILHGASVIVRDVNATDGYSGASATDAIVSSLMSIEYQERLAYGVSITSVYESFSTTPSDYGITQKSNTLGSFTGTDTLTFGYYDGDDIYSTESFYVKFTYVFAYRESIFSSIQTQNIDYIIEYKVSRYLA
ncbi:leucine-rich repeat domain-containing protein [Acholeplasma sp. OttesenSCG-928-E16]|nr:leucine-rich repeat domain-containing protein [Acholeplasma sp. OttesenSCG-928-E16]